ncbi:MAG: type II toxin-antitoxin system HicB family antitoxin [Desulfovibrio sp.]|jgi:predicted HicB family RNase H-like nuclease|nr:type II toxin-antitoxin system HicB family antitoxin [Desulfovibrio sp.]
MTSDVLMEYKGYTARIHYSEEDGCYVGKIVGIQDIVVFDGETLEEIRKTFEEDVESYSQCCAEAGREPNKPAPEILIPVSSSLYAQLSKKAEYDGVPVHTLMETALQKFVAQHA